MNTDGIPQDDLCKNGQVTATIDAAIAEAGRPADSTLSAYNRRRVLESEW